MTAVLDEIKRMEAARDRGELGDVEFARLRHRLLDSIEDAEVVAETGKARTIQAEAPAARHVRAARSPAVAEPQAGHDPRRAEIWAFVLAALAGFSVCTALAAWILADLTLALTLAATLLAAITVRAFRKLGD